MFAITDVLKSIVLEANPKLSSERVKQLVEKYTYPNKPNRALYWIYVEGP